VKTLGWSETLCWNMQEQSTDIKDSQTIAYPISRNSNLPRIRKSVELQFRCASLDTPALFLGLPGHKLSSPPRQFHPFCVSLGTARGPRHADE
jgi:hypothetical protein